MSKQNHSALLGGVRVILLPCGFSDCSTFTQAVAGPSSVFLNLPLACKINQQQKNKTILCPVYGKWPLKICGVQQQSSVIAVCLDVIFFFFFWKTFFFFYPLVCQPSNKVSQHDGATCLTMVLLQDCGEKQQYRTSEADSREKVMCRGFTVACYKC